MKTYKHTLIFLTLVCVASCNNSSESKNKVEITENSVKTYVIDGRTDSLIEVQHEDFDEEQPFIHDCKANFHRFGEHKINGIVNIYYSGKGWNSTLYSCSYTWGEIIYNEFPPDDKTNLIVHLLDLNEFPIPQGNSEYGNDTIKKYVIAIFYRDKDTCIYDPYKTGKYSKSQWWKD